MRGEPSQPSGRVARFHTVQPQPLLVHHRISQHSHTLHAHFHHTPRHHRPPSLRRPRRNQISREQSHRLRNISNHLIQIKNKIPRIPLLPCRAIHPRLHPNPGPRIKPVHHHRPYRTKSIAPLRPRPLPIFFLQVARRNIVQARVSQNVTAHIFIGRRLVASLSDHHAQLAFKIHALGNLRPPHHSPRPQQRRTRL